MTASDEVPLASDRISNFIRWFWIPKRIAHYFIYPVYVPGKGILGGEPICGNNHFKHICFLQDCAGEKCCFHPGVRNRKLAWYIFGNEVK
jgi:hypothetical protein